MKFFAVAASCFLLLAMAASAEIIEPNGDTSIEYTIRFSA
jgi:hypothetical protein